MLFWGNYATINLTDVLSERVLKMEFNIKLQELRKSRSLTQEELAAALYVSRTAVSKWESGRGLPGIDSLRAIAAYFGITIDELLSGDELLSLADNSAKKESHLRDMVFGLLDISTAMLFFLPFFGQSATTGANAVSLLGLATTEPFLKFGYYAVVIGLILLGVATLAFQNCRKAFWAKTKVGVSLALGTLGALLFVAGQHPYAAALMLVFQNIKALTIIHK